MQVSFAIVLFPEKAISKEISTLSAQISSEYGIRGNPKHKIFPPHISLRFQGDVTDEKGARDLVAQLKNGCHVLSPFNVCIDGLEYYIQRGKVTRYAVCLNVINSKRLNKLFKFIDSSTKNYQTAGNMIVAPHITLVRYGLDKANFIAIKKAYRNMEFKRVFTAKCIFVGLQKGGTGNWKLAKLYFDKL